MNEERPKMSLANLAGGAAAEAFDEAMQEVLNNIVDPNTPPEVPREVVLKVRIKPNKDRNLGSVSFQAVSKLAPAEALETMIVIDEMPGGKGVASELAPGIKHDQHTLLRMAPKPKESGNA